MTSDCGFTAGKNWFRYRAAAIIVENGCVLLVRNEKDKFFYSVGGGVHIGETAENAVVRECFEETGVHYEIDRLSVIHENFWNGGGAYDKGLNCHEIAFYYLMKPRGTMELHSNSYTRFGDKEIMCWIPIEELDKHRVYPTFLKEYLCTKQTEIKHIVTDERR